jgi:hypothetical protein
LHKENVQPLSQGKIKCSLLTYITYIINIDIRL